MVVSSLWLGLLAAACTCTGLAVVRRLPPGPRPRGLLTMGAAGLVLFVLIEVGSQALGTVELVAVSASQASLVVSGVLLLGGLLLGMAGLAWVESRRGHPGADAPQPLDVAVMLAIAIGLRNFAEGLAAGQSIATTLSGPGAWLVAGLAVHGLLYGAAAATPVAGEPMPPSRLFLLAACAAGPSLFGTVVGTTWVGPGLELLVLSVSSGALVYVLRELFRAPLAGVTARAAMWAIFVGLLAGLIASLMMNAGRY
jgi:ZIP family zinc transporter